MSAPTSTVNTDYYIIVKKDGGKFTIEDTIPQSPNTLDKRNPADIIIQPDSAVVYFPIKVTKSTSSGSTPPNSFDVNGITYTLILDTAIEPDRNDKNLIINENNFATFTTSPAVQPGNNNTDTTGTGQSAGGNKQKQRRSKRNYSKKQRKQWAKNNTLRNYFNYNESAL